MVIQTFTVGQTLRLGLLTKCARLPPVTSVPSLVFTIKGLALQMQIKSALLVVRLRLAAWSVKVPQNVKLVEIHSKSQMMATPVSFVLMDRLLTVKMFASNVWKVVLNAKIPLLAWLLLTDIILTPPPTRWNNVIDSNQACLHVKLALMGVICPVQLLLMGILPQITKLLNAQVVF